MQHFSSRFSSRIIALALALAVTMALSSKLFSAIAAQLPETPDATVRSAWLRAQQAGQYEFETRIQQTVFPALSLGNVGESPRETYIELTGQTDVPAQAMHMTLKPERSSNAVPTESEVIEFKIEGDQSFIRTNGAAWQSSDANVGMFAPGSDALAFLAAAKNIQAAGKHIVLGQSFTRFAFQVDGPAFAKYSRDQMQAYLDRKGRLPGGVTLGLSEQYAQMQASGMVWLDANGMPARISMDVALPQDASGERTTLKFSTNLNNYAVPALAPPSVAAPLQALGGIGGKLSFPTASDEQQVAALRLGLFLVFLLVAALLAMRGVAQQCNVVRGVQGVLIALLLVQPLALEMRPANAFIAEQQQKADAQLAAAKAAQAEQKQQKELIQALTGARDWNPNQPVAAQRSPDAEAIALLNLTAPAEAVLLQGRANKPGFSNAFRGTKPGLFALSTTNLSIANNTSTDTDSDGLSNEVEAVLGTAADKADTDGDGLSDGDEAIKLGLSATSADSDRDGSPDLSEVRGWRDVTGRQWYTDPGNPDTDGDGLLDSVECPKRAGNDATQWGVCADTDGDATPDVFDQDSDGDGVNDDSDTASTRALPGSQPSAVYNAQTPFQFKAKGVMAKQQVYLDFQIRPKNGEHLAWHNSVLDWPSNDTEGQITTYTETLTIAKAANYTANQIQNDPAAVRGNLRLMPMLEINLGSNPPLKRAGPKAELSVRNSDDSISGTLSFSRTSDSTTRMNFSFAQPSGAVNIGLYDNSSCTSVNYASQLFRYTGVASGADTNISQSTLKLLQGQRVAVISATVGSAVKQACAALPDLPNGNDPQQMVDTTWLSGFGVSVNDLGNGNAQKEMLAYVPLNVTYNAKGTRREAWSARMPYWQTGNDWGDTQRANIVWMLQLFNKPGAGPNVIHRYYDDWKLAGLDFTEDHGVNVTVFGSSPSAISDLSKNDNMRLRVTSGLDSDLLRPRQSSTTQQRLTLAEIAARFGAAGSGAWGLPKADVNVQQYAFATEGELGLLPTKHNQDILNSWYGSSSNNLAQLVIARESTQRNLGLEDELMQPEKDGGFLINADPNQIPKQVVTSYSLSPFKKDAGVWRSQPVQEFADSVSSEYRKIFKADAPTGLNVNDPAQVDAAAFIARNALVSMVLSAPSAPVQQGPAAGFDVETPPAKWILGSGTAIKGVVDEISGQLLGVIDELSVQGKQILNLVRSQSGEAAGSAATAVKRGFGSGLQRSSGNKWDQVGTALGNRELTNLFKEGSASKFGAVKKIFKSELTKNLAKGALALATVTASVVSIALGNNAWAAGVAQVLTVLSSLNALNDALNIRRAYTSFKALKDTTDSLYKSMKSTINTTARAAKIGAIIGAVISIGISVGLFLYQGLTTGFTGQLVAQLIAEVIVAVAMLILSLLFPVGTVIAAVIALLDAMAAGICFVVDKLRTDGEKSADGAVGKWLCGGITGALIKGLGAVLYRSETVIDLSDADRLKFGEFDVQLQDNAKGFVQGANVNYQLTLQPSGKLKKFVSSIINNETDSDIDDNFGTVARSKFEYVLRRAADLESNIPSPDASTDNRALWSSRAYTSLLDTGERVSNAGDDDGTRMFQKWQKTNLLVYPLAQTGINVQDDVNLVERYAVYENNCYVSAYCQWSVKKDGSVMPLKLKWDVLPTTLDGFKSHTPKDGGYSFAWGQLGNLVFARQKDFDGDGLMNTTDGGNDPDDTAADSDGDGLMDEAELKLGTNPKRLDSDSDTLRDDVEHNLGLNPLRADSDADGLSDADEVNGWEFVYGFEANGTPIKTQVRSNPLQADGDNDGMLDGLEKIYGRHPNVADNANVLALRGSAREVQSAVVLLRLDEAANASSFLNAVNANKNATCAGGTCPAAGVPGLAGSAVRFDGVDDALTIESPVSLARASFTLAFWAKRAGAGTDDFVISQGSNTANNGLHVGWRSNDKFVCDFFGNALESDNAYGADSAFHHWACTYDVASGQRALYRDGVMLKSGIALSPFVGGGNFVLGNSSWGGAEFFGGDLDEVVVVADALRQTDVQRLMLSRFAYADGVLGRGEPLELSTTINNELDARNATGLLEGRWDANTFTGPVLREPFNIEPLTGITVTRRLTVSNSAPPGLTRLDEQAGAQIVDLREQSGFAELWLKLDENPVSGSYTGVIFKDSSGHRPSRNAACTAGNCPQSNNGLYLNNAELSVEGVDLSNSSHTVFFRARRAQSNTDQFIVAQGTAGFTNQYLHVGWRANNKFTCDSYGNGFDVDGGSEGTEYAWACVYDANGNTRAIYRDGALQGSAAASGNFLGKGTLKIGSSQFNTSRFQGYLSDLRLFRRALNNDEVANLSNGGGTRFAFDYWPNSSSTCTHGLECPAQRTNDAGLPSTAGPAWEFNGRAAAKIDSAKGSASGSSFSQAFWVQPNSPISLQGYNGSEGACSDVNPIFVRYLERGNDKQIYTACISLDEYGLVKDWGDGNIESTGRNNDVYIQYYIQFNLNYGSPMNFHLQADDDVDLDKLNGSNWERIFRADVGGTGKQEDHRTWWGAGQHKLRVRFYEKGGGAAFNFRWDEWAKQAQTQAIIGDAGNVGNRWQSGPIVERVDNKLKVSFRDTNNNWQERTTSPILARNQWQHVAITFNNGVYKFYINGEKREEITIPGSPIPKPNSQFYLGSSNFNGDLYVRNFRVKSDGDGAGTAEICLRWAGTAFGSRYIGDDSSGKQETNVDASKSTTSHGELLMWEEDGNDNCGDKASGDEQLGSWNFSITDPAAPPMIFGYTGDGEGALRLGGNGRKSWAVPATPFKGKLADLRTLRYTLSDAQVRALFDSYATAAHFKLDEAPGAGLGKTGFKNEVLGASGICNTTTCPTTGVQGRLQQSAFFDGVDDKVTQGAGTTPDLANRSFTVAFWAKRSTAGSNDMAVAQGNGETRKGLHVGFRDNNRFTCGFGGADLDTSATYPADTEFVHWACTFEFTGVDTGTRKIYRNGIEVASASNAASYLGSGPLIIGDAAHFAAPFHGWLDDVRVYYTALSTADVEKLVNSAPTASFAFDEPLNSTRFANAANSGAATCSGTSCPKAELQGQLFSALEFDGVNDYLTIPDTVATKMSGNHYTVMAWVRLAGVNSKNPIFSYRNTGYGGEVYAAGWVEDGYPKWYLDYARYQASTQLLPNTWYHLTFSYDLTNRLARIYVNGQMVREDSFTFTDFERALPIAARIGSNHFDAYFKGRIDDYTAYGRALSPAEVLSIFTYQQGLVSDRDSQTLKIDTDAPTSFVNAIAHNSYRSNATVQISSIASDTQSSVQLVDVALSQYSGATLPAPAWQAAQPCAGANDGAAWCAYISPSTEGKYRLQSRAVDVAGNLQGPPAGVDFFVDASAPTVSIAQHDGATLRGQSNDNGRTFTITLNGTANDPALAGGFAGSGTKRVLVSLVRVDGADVSGSTQQSATLAGTSWLLHYVIGGDATGAYTVTVTAEDNAGNTTSLPAQTLNIDVSSPLARSLVDASRVISASAVITGSANETGSVQTGVKQVQVQLEPVDAVPVNPYASVSDANLVAYLPLNSDVASEGQQLSPNAAFVGALDGVCAPLNCPSYSAGVVDKAANFGRVGNNVRSVQVPHDSTQAFDGNLTLALWAKPDYADNGQVLLERWSGGNGYALAQFERFLVLYVGSAGSVKAYVVNGLEAYRWQHVAVVIPANGLPRVFINGSPRTLLSEGDVLAARPPYWVGLRVLQEIKFALYAPASISTGSAALLGDIAQPLNVGMGKPARFNGQMDEMRVYHRALSNAEVATLSVAPAATVLTWQDATLGAANANNTAWSFGGLPAGAEGAYRINLRTEDNAGNTETNNNPTQIVVIDRHPPQIVAMTRTLDSALNATRIRVQVQDRTPSNNLQIDVPACTFDVKPLMQTTADSWTLGALSKDNLPRTGILASCVVSGLLTSPIAVTACDLAGQCTTSTSSVQVNGGIYGATQPVGELRETYLGAGSGLSLSLDGPLAHSWLTSTAPIALNGAATASTSLRQLGIYVNDSPIYTQTWAQGVTTSFGFAESYTPTAPGAYNVEVRAESWPTTTTLALNEGWEGFAVGTGFGDVAAPSNVWTKIVERRLGTANEEWFVDNGVGTHSGGNAVFFNAATNDVADSARLQSPVFSLVGLPSPKLRFWLRHANLNKNDGLLVQVRVNGATWIDQGQIIYPNNTDDCLAVYCWREHGVDLNDYAQYANVEVGFVAYSDRGEHVVLDDISVGSVEQAEVSTSALVNTAAPSLTVQSWNAVGVRGAISQSSNSQVVVVDVTSSGGLRDDNRVASVSGQSWSLSWQPARAPLAGELFTFTARLLEGEEVVARAARAFNPDVTLPAINLPSVSVNAQGVVPVQGTILDANAYLTTTLSFSESNTLRTVWYGWLLYERPPDVLVNDDGSLDIPLFTGVKRTDNPSGQSFTDNTLTQMPINFGVDGGARYFYMAAQDSNGNFSQQMFGPYVQDTTNRPDYVELINPSKPYLDWTKTGCTELGYDDRSSQRQTMYMTNADQGRALALAWRGLDPTKDGDLFVYLENGANGSRLAYNPFAETVTNTLLLLPDDGVRQMRANYALHVSGSLTATLVRYDSANQTWQPERSLGRYTDSGATFNGWFEVVDDGSEKVLVLKMPLSLIGNSQPSHVLGLATEDDGLRIWASVPRDNPLTSRRMARLAPALSDPSRAALGSQVYVQPCDRGGGGLRTRLEVPQGVSLAKGDLNAQFVQPPISMSLFAGYTETATYTSWLNSSYCPANPEHPECITDKQTSAKVQRQLLSELGDVDQPPLQPGQVVTLTFSFDFPGSLVTNANTYFFFKLNSDAPVSWPNGCAYIGAQPGSGTAGVFNVPPFSPALEFSVPFTVGAQTVERVWVTTYWNNTFGVPSMGGDCGQSAPPAGTSFGDSVVLFTPDRQAPQALKVNSPQVMSNTLATVRGTVIDLSPIDAITLEVTSVGGGTSVQVCPDANPTDGLWQCDVDLVARNGGNVPSDGQTFGFRAIAQDRFGQVSEWSPGFLAAVDGAPAELELDTESLALVALGTLSVDEFAASNAVVVTSTQLQGEIRDNRLLSRVTVCDTNGVCDLAEVTNEVNRLPPAQYTFDDVPAAPLGFGDGSDAANVCGPNTTGLVRSFTITNTFLVGEIKVGVNITHSYRGDVAVQLRSPQGLVRTLFNGDGRAAAHVDALFINDLKQAENFINVSDDPSLPHYDALRASAESLAPYIGIDAAGTWQLWVCDQNAAGDSGLFNQASLMLADSAVVSQTRGTWNYAIPNASNMDNVTGVYTVTAYDDLGNASAPLHITANIDAVAPLITVTQLVSVTLANTETLRAFSGSVSDGGTVSNVVALVALPDGNLIELPTVLDGVGGWALDLPREMGGVYDVAFQAVDANGNTRTSGAYSVTVLAQAPVQLFFRGNEQTLLGDVVSFTARLENPSAWPVSGMVTFTIPDGIAPITLLSGTGVSQQGSLIVWQVSALTATTFAEIGFSGVVISDTQFAGRVLTVTGQSDLSAISPDTGLPVSLNALPSNEGYAKIASIAVPEDDISPTLSVQQLMTQTMQATTPMLSFAGTVTDNVDASTALGIVAVITAPNGISVVLPISVGVNGEFELNVPIDQQGVYLVRIEARDTSDNLAVAGEFSYTVLPAQVTVTQLASIVPLTTGVATVFTGSVVGGHAPISLTAYVSLPSGSLIEVPVAINADGSFAVNLPANAIGVYQVTLKAQIGGEPPVVVGVYRYRVLWRRNYYFPLMYT